MGIEQDSANPRRRHARPVDPQAILVPQRQPVVDPRGTILNLIDVPLSSAAVITSVKGAIRGNHYHKTDAHYCWLQKGRMIYYQRPVGDSAHPTRMVIHAGQLFYTPPMHEHAMYFTQASVMFVLARNSRTMANYEADTIRIPSIVAS